MKFNSTQIKCNLSRLFPTNGILGVSSMFLQNACLPPTREKKKKSEKERREVQEKKGQTENKEERRKHEGLRKLPTRLLVTNPR